MSGLDRTVLDQLDPELALGRIKSDLQSDFILSPHYAAVFEYIGDQLWGELEANLRNGTYEPALPIIIEVPKANGITRPGAILNPTDRLIHQALIDTLALIGEAQLDAVICELIMVQNHPNTSGLLFSLRQDTSRFQKSARVSQLGVVIPMLTL
jgi:hypothetical protein